MKLSNKSAACSVIRMTSSRSWTLDLFSAWVGVGAPLFLALYLYSGIGMWVRVEKALLLAALVYVVFTSKTRLRVSACLASPAVWGALWGSALLFSSLLSDRSSSSTASTRALLGALLWLSVFWISAARCRNGQKFSSFVKWIDIGCVLVSLSTVTSLLLNKWGVDFGEVLIIGDSNLRVFGPLGDNGPYVILFSLIYSLIRGKWLWALVHGLAVLIAGTRGVLLVGFAALAFYLIFSIVSDLNTGARRRAVLRVFSVTGVIVAATLALYLTSYGKFLRDRIGDMHSLVETDALGGRLTNMAFAVELVKERLWFGWGYNQYEHQAKCIYGEELKNEMGFWRFGITNNANNQLVQTAVDGGVVAGCFFCALVGSVVVRCVRVLKMSPACEKRALLSITVYSSATLVGLQSTIYLSDMSIIGYYLFAAVGVIEGSYHRYIKFGYATN